ncbi:DUF4145 domain-containing protein [Variovorax paradoxus]|uniref:DUF4145 domain-containing protein n=2 Tax=Variovorax paradoxus TaxID=34073 RepID=A0A5Q0M4Y1_VARPD|nr:DUF4145 domain-containing protein [Variovorax paradoxus]
MDRRVFNKHLRIEEVPDWRCPVCKSGNLTLDPKAFQFDHTAESRRDQSIPDAGYDWVRYQFVCFLTCSRATCGERISCLGWGEVEQVQFFNERDQEMDVAYVDQFFPTYFDPPLVLMDVPKECPEDVAGHLRTSFSMYFCNPGASLNSARMAVEALMDHLKVVDTWPDGKRMDLHFRIKRIPKEHVNVMDHLLAVKYLGNAGSHHGDKPKREDVNDVYDVLEYALNKIFDQSEGRLKLLVERINKDKGLPK